MRKPSNKSSKQVYLNSKVTQSIYIIEQKFLRSQVLEDFILQNRSQIPKIGLKINLCP